MEESFRKADEAWAKQEKEFQVGEHAGDDDEGEDEDQE